MGGKWRGRKLTVPVVDSLRPTPDRVRETLFNWLQGDIEGSVCLDLFAGSGALSFEAASRGAREVVLVEKNKDAIEAIKLHKEMFSADEIKVIQADAMEWLQSTDYKFDVVFLDPPFTENMLLNACNLIVEKNILRPGALLYIETERGNLMEMKNLQIIKQSTAGQVQYMLLEKKENDRQ